MTTSEPTTGEMIERLRIAIDQGTERVVIPSAGVKMIADRLESQEREIAELEEALKPLIPIVANQRNEIIVLTAHAEQAERERDAAINEAIRAVFYDMSDGKPALLLGEGICRYCQSDKGERIKCKSCFENGNFELRNNLRGLPQEGEGK